MIIRIVFIAVLFGLTYGQTPKTKIGKSDTNQTVKTQNDSFPVLPQGAIIHVRKGNQIFCFLPKNMEIQGVICRGHNNDWETGFYTNGKLSLAWLPRDQVIQGVPCMKATFWTEVLGKSAKVLFWDNGQLKRCKAAKDCLIQGHAFKKGDIIRFNRKGKLIFGGWSH